MKLLLYCSGTNGTGERLQHAMEGVAHTHKIELCQTIAGLSNRLRQRTADLTAVVLCASTEAELAEILALREWLCELRTILILPDRESETVSQGLTLRPRFCSFIDTDFSDVSAVLAKMLRVFGNGSTPT
jgi:hypothetical protein